MIDTNQMEKDFIERRKKCNEWASEHGRNEKEFLDENPKLLIITYKNGRGAMVIDYERLSKLPKGVQDKIFSLGNLDNLNKERKKILI